MYWSLAVAVTSCVAPQLAAVAHISGQFSGPIDKIKKLPAWRSG